MSTIKTTLFSILAISGIAISGLAGLAISSSAQVNNAPTYSSLSVNTSSSVSNKDNRPAEQKAVDDALTKKDYEAWKTAVKNTPNGQEFLTKVDTQDKFNKLVEAHDYQDKAQAIYKELGLPKGPRGGMIQGMRGGMPGADALDKNDYEAWKTAVKNAPNGQEILTKIDTQDKFNKLVEAHNLMKSGDKTKAETILNELGLPKPEKQMMGNRPQRNNQTQSSVNNSVN